MFNLLQSRALTQSRKYLLSVVLLDGVRAPLHSASPRTHCLESLLYILASVPLLPLILLLKNFARSLHMAVFQDPANAASVKGISGLFPGLCESLSFLPSEVL